MFESIAKNLSGAGLRRISKISAYQVPGTLGHHRRGDPTTSPRSLRLTKGKGAQPNHCCWIHIFFFQPQGLIWVGPQKNDRFWMILVILSSLTIPFQGGHFFCSFGILRQVKMALNPPQRMDGKFTAAMTSKVVDLANTDRGSSAMQNVEFFLTKLCGGNATQKNREKQGHF